MTNPDLRLQATSTELGSIEVAVALEVDDSSVVLGEYIRSARFVPRLSAALRGERDRARPPLGQIEGYDVFAGISSIQYSTLYLYDAGDKLGFAVQDRNGQYPAVGTLDRPTQKAWLRKLEGLGPRVPRRTSRWIG